MITLIAAMTRNRVIGKNNTLPWYLPEDLKRFKRLTTGHSVIVGWNTFISILASFKNRGLKPQPLPDRTHYVLTSKTEAEVEVLLAELFPDFEYKRYKDRVIFCNSYGSAVQRAERKLANPSDEIFVIGGAKVYEQAIYDARKIYLTVITQDMEGDAYFPELNNAEWQEFDKEEYDGYYFTTLIK